MNNISRTVIFFLALFLLDAVITYLFPNLIGPWRNLVILFVIIALGLLIFPRAPILWGIFSKNTSSSMTSGIGQTQITPAFGISVVAAILLGALIQIYFFPELANLPGLIGDIGSIAIPLVLLGVVLVFYKKKR